MDKMRFLKHIEMHYLLKKNRRGRACFSMSIRTVIRATSEEVFKEELAFLVDFLRKSNWKHADEMRKWFLSTSDEELKAMGVIIDRSHL
ncbi:MAG: hypothetical protein PHY30_01715 [Candidatus Pacebacteria bacterium]|nr:hypothetical protein [Candidatus Paceibacterota bacterium]